MQNILEPVAPQGSFIWRDLKWVNRAPEVQVEPCIDGTPDGTLLSVPLTPESFLGVAVIPEDSASGGRYCSGFALARTDTAGFRHLPCPTSQPIVKGRQCDRCLGRDEFAPIHRVHMGARMTEAALAYVNLEHYLYIATFPDGTSKVGTASAHSNPRRLDEQAVAFATFVARADDGRIVRMLEDLVSRESNLTQFKRASTKYRAWIDPLPADQLKSEHYMAVESATWALEDAELDGFELLQNRWHPSAAMSRAYASLRADDRLPLAGYESLAAGSHGFFITGGAGKFLTAHCGDPEASFLVNTADLANRACTLFDGLTPPASFQTSLF